ncbi:MAG: hypothetical protein K2L12_04405 [Clostridia bacterium]|nr:hypothetical protein [Clostridia bacterium]
MAKMKVVVPPELLQIRVLGIVERSLKFKKFFCQNPIFCSFQPLYYGGLLNEKLVKFLIDRGLSAFSTALY